MRRQPHHGAPEVALRGRRSAVVVIGVLVIAAFQLIVPAAVMLAGPNERAREGEYRYRYGWQMFTQTEVTVRYTVSPRHGPPRTMDPRRELGSFWGHVHYGAGDLTRLCRRLPDAVVITRSVMSGAEEPDVVATHRCR